MRIVYFQGVGYLIKGIYVLDDCDLIYCDEVKKEINQNIEILAPPQTKESILENKGLLADVDVLFSGWGAPKLDKTLLDYAPNLKVVFHGAGSAKKVVSDVFWERGIILTTAAKANAIPTAEFALSQIIFSLKRGWYYVFNMKECKENIKREKVFGAYGSTVGIISLGAVGCHVARLLQNFDVNVIAYDPYVSQEIASGLNVKLHSLEEVFCLADVVSLHTPYLPETEGMITGQHIASMKNKATLINTARGQIVRQEEMLDVLLNRPDLYAVLDVTHPWKIKPQSKLYRLYELQNVIMTPHIAGSQSTECFRMGRFMLDELKRFIKKEPLYGQVTKEQISLMA